MNTQYTLRRRPIKKRFVDGHYVWAKVGDIWWPAEVYDDEKVPVEVQRDELAIAYVRFFQHNTFMTVVLHDGIDMYQCSRKMQFIQEGVDLVRSGKYKHLDKFPDDVAIAELGTSGDYKIIQEFGFTPHKLRRRQRATALNQRPNPAKMIECAFDVTVLCMKCTKHAPYDLCVECIC